MLGEPRAQDVDEQHVSQAREQDLRAESFGRARRVDEAQHAFATLAARASERSETAASSVGEGSGRTTARATIAVSVWQPEPYDSPDAGPQLVRIHVEESFAGDISGSGIATFLQALRADGSGSFCGVDRVVGSIAGRSGSFVLQDAGRSRTGS